MSSDSFLLLPRPWLKVDAAMVERGADRRYETRYRSADAMYVKGEVRDATGETVRRLAYWHQVVTATGPAATSGTAIRGSACSGWRR